MVTQKENYRYTKYYITKNYNKVPVNGIGMEITNKIK